jgi:uncharacterized protein (TIGR02145 family)
MYIQFLKYTMKINSLIAFSLLATAFLSGACRNTTSPDSNPAQQNLSGSLHAEGGIKIGGQTWAVANLDITHFKNGDLITEAKTPEEWKKAGEKASPAWSYYENDATNGKKYGKLYNWYAVHDNRGLAANGWHIPADTEWDILINYLGGADSAGTKMKSASGWMDEGNGTNSSGFTGIQGGYRYNNGAFNGMGKYGSWWSSTAFDSSGAWYRFLTSVNGKVTRNFSDQRDGFSVRCLRD